MSPAPAGENRSGVRARCTRGSFAERNAMPNAARLEWIGNNSAAILSALVATAVGIGQYRRGVSQSIRELEWRQADMARTMMQRPDER